MKFSKFAIWWAGLAFFGFGWAYLIWPHTMIELSGMQIPTPVAVTDARAMYGGYQIGFGAFLLYCAIRSEWIWPGLIASLWAFGGIVLCRVLGFVLDGSAGEYHLSALALVEVPGVLFAAISLCRERSCGACACCDDSCDDNAEATCCESNEASCCASSPDASKGPGSGGGCCG